MAVGGLLGAGGGCPAAPSGGFLSSWRGDGFVRLRPQLPAPSQCSHWCCLMCLGRPAVCGGAAPAVR
eukprot:10305888-Alexandrium_andersonii.AAC.1